ncbi:unnamed protein product [Rotaria sordida]|uniref:Uncharacterized protein n=1 Tax=Rotaria sordida TaxID=392033 RepID=A0A814X9E5_9BILA|nr:unnamed protein product [Rotaria sordida]CAF3728636.1 unnamed protein product [Rotaria sordida]
MASKDENRLSDGTEPMDDEKSSVPEEESQQYSERPGLAGPMNWFVCIQFILMTGSNTELSKRRYIDTDRIVDWLSMNNTDIDDEIDQLQELAKQYFLNLYICIINQNQKSYYYMDATSVEASTSIESAEASSMVSNESSNSHEEDILPNVRISIEPSLPWNFQSTTSTNTDSLPNTTNIIQQTIELPKLVLLNQPKRFWHHRESATLSNGCPAIQVEGAPQRTALLLGLPQEIQNYQQEFYIGTHVTTYNGNEHKQKLVVPNNTKIKKNHKSMLNNIGCLEFDEKQKFSVEFDSISKGVFSKVDSNDLENLQKKLIFAIYIKLHIGQFERVSLPTYSDLIKETHASQSLDFDNIFPNELCERGGQMIFIKLRESIEKNKLYVHCNGKLLNQNDFQVDKTILSFESPVCTQNRKDVEVTAHIEKTPGYTTYTVPYHLHNDHSEPCGVINED